MRLLIAQTQMYQKSFSIKFRLMRRFVNVFRQFIHLDIIVLCLMSESFIWLKRNFCSYFGSVRVLIRNFCVDKNRTLIRRSYRICVTQLNLSPSTISLFVYTDTVYRLFAPHIKIGFLASFADNGLFCCLFYVNRLKCVQRECSTCTLIRICNENQSSSTYVRYVRHHSNVTDARKTAFHVHIHWTNSLGLEYVRFFRSLGFWLVWFLWSLSSVETTTPIFTAYF